MPVRILLTSTSYPRTPESWQGIFIRSMVEALARQPGLQLHVWAPPGPLPNGVAAACTPAEAAWLEGLAGQGGIAHLLRTRRLAGLAAALKLVGSLRAAFRREPADLFHANWLQSALAMTGTRTPAVVTVLGTDFALLKLPGMAPLLRHALGQRRCVVAPNAEWMVAPLQRLLRDSAQVEAVPFGVDERWYRLARQPAGGPRRWLVVSRLTAAKLGPLFEWGAGLFGRDDELHLFGPQQEGIAVPDWVHYHGPTHAAQLAAEWFPRAAGLVTLSRHDEGRPQVVLEAMAAGLPVIASRLPAHEGIIRHMQTGWLVSGRDDFAAGLRALADPQRNAGIGEAARGQLRATVGTWDDCAARYVTLYRRLLDGR